MDGRRCYRRPLKESSAGCRMSDRPLGRMSPGERVTPCNRMVSGTYPRHSVTRQSTHVVRPARQILGTIRRRDVRSAGFGRKPSGASIVRTGHKPALRGIFAIKLRKAFFSGIETHRSESTSGALRCHTETACARTATAADHDSRRRAPKVTDCEVPVSGHRALQTSAASSSNLSGRATRLQWRRARSSAG